MLVTGWSSTWMGRTRSSEAAVLTCATNVANTIAELNGVTLSGGTIYSDCSDTQTTRPSVEPVPPQKHYSIWENFIGGIFSMLA